MTSEQQKKYNYWQWRTLIALIFGYTLYYFVRKNFSVIIPALESELGISKVSLGLFLSLNGIVYGVSRFVNGIIVDRGKKRIIMTLGLIFSGLINLAICFSPALNSIFTVLDTEGKATSALIIIIGSLWVINGYVQGMGVPPCISLMAHWIKPSEIATKQSIWNASHSIGAGLIAVFCGWILNKFGYSSWQLCFAIPAAVAIVGAFALYTALRDTPSSVGLPEISEMEDEGAVKEEKHNEPELTSAQKTKFMNKMVYQNPIIWMLALANFFVYIIRFTILDWGTSILTDFKGLSIGLAGTVVALSEIGGGIVGMLFFGWFSDKVMKSKAHQTCLICTIGATLMVFAFWQLPKDATVLSIICIIMSSFFIYGPQALLGICASQQATRSACGTANGILGIFGYIAPLISGVGFGALAENYGWNSVFVVSVIMGLLGCAILALIWKAPADGYARADKVIKEITSQQ